MPNLFKKSFGDADEVKSPEKTRAEVVKLGNVNVTRLELQPGWKWSECIKPVVGGHSCQAGHVGVILQGKMMCVHDDGTEVLAEAGEAYYFAPGHDGWVVGDEPLVGYASIDCLRSGRPSLNSNRGASASRPGSSTISYRWLSSWRRRFRIR